VERAEELPTRCSRMSRPVAGAARSTAHISLRGRPSETAAATASRAVLASVRRRPIMNARDEGQTGTDTPAPDEASSCVVAGAGVSGRRLVRVMLVRKPYRQTRKGTLAGPFGGGCAVELPTPNETSCPHDMGALRADAPTRTANTSVFFLVLAVAGGLSSVACSGAPCASSAPLIVDVSDLKCAGRVSVAGACSSPGCGDPDATCCTQWFADMYDRDDGVCTVTLTLADGSTETQRVSITHDSVNDDCFSGASVHF
jgi:hypothetical protein